MTDKLVRMGHLAEVATSPDHEWWLDEGGSQVQLFFNMPHRTPIGPKIAIEMDADNHVTPVGPYYSYVQDAPVNLKKVYFLLFNQIRPRFMGNDEKEPETDEAFQQRWDEAQFEIDHRALLMEQLYRYVARHVWDFRVEGHVYESNNRVDSPDYDKVLVKQAIKDQNITLPYTGIQIYAQHRTHITSRCGSAYRHGIPIPYGVVYRGRPQRSSDHEAGHTGFAGFGLGHAGKRSKGGGVETYGDIGCAMGGSTSERPGFNAPHSLIMGIKGVRQSRTVDTTTQVLVVPLELDEHSLFHNEDQSVIVRIPGEEDHTLSIRKQRGTYYQVPKYKARTLFIHTGSGTTVQEATLDPGESHVVGGARIQYLEYDNEYERARIDIVYGNDPIPAGDLPGMTGFPVKLGKAHITEAHSGLWYNPDHDRQGFDLHVRGQRGVVYWYNFNEKEQSRRWWYGTFSLIEGPRGFPLYTRDKLTGDSILAGHAQLFFFTGSRGVFNFRTTEHGRGSCEIIPVALSDSPQSNVYYDPAYPNTGFSIQFLNNDTFCTAYWYDYGPASGDHPPGIQTQRWYMCSGPMNRGGWYDLIIYEFTNGRWQFVNEATLNTVGEATLKIEWFTDDDGNDIPQPVFEYVMGDESGTRNLTGKVL